jgi:hypothetical protein
MADWNPTELATIGGMQAWWKAAEPHVAAINAEAAKGTTIRVVPR